MKNEIAVKMSPEGAVLKTKFYGGNCEDDLFRSVIESNDGKPNSLMG